MANTRYLVVLSFLVAMAGALHAVEALLPLPLPVPGAKLGLANIVSLFLLVTFDLKSALYVTVARVILGSLLAGSFLGTAFLMSLGGGIFSVLAMHWFLTKRTPLFSVYGISVIGAAVHNTVQVVLAACLVASQGLLWYVPYLIFFAVPTGIFTGALVIYLTARLPKNLVHN
ncbi:MAG: Gx transporter family protein [Sporomusaceae bacterium]|jgi:heptaprenyl diphosphate synthase|nr:Gx transporter family protein [Sporomusaceae bacterium]